MDIMNGLLPNDISSLITPHICPYKLYCDGEEIYSHHSYGVRKRWEDLYLDYHSGDAVYLYTTPPSTNCPIHKFSKEKGTIDVKASKTGAKWTLSNAKSNAIVSSGDLSSAGSLPFNINEEGTYKFKVTTEDGKGLRCPSLSRDAYVLSLDGQEVYGSYGEFGKYQTVTFTVDSRGYIVGEASAEGDECPTVPDTATADTSTTSSSTSTLRMWILILSIISLVLASIRLLVFCVARRNRRLASEAVPAHVEEGEQRPNYGAVA